MRLTITIIGLVLLCSVTAPAVFAANNALTVTLEPARITVTGVTPGAQVLFFGAGFEPQGFHAVLHRWSKVVSDTQHGSVSYVFDAPVTWNSLWIVADLRTGSYAVISTPGFPTIKSELTRRSLKRDATGAVSQLHFSRPAADFLYIAPGGGAWSLLARDGDENDADGSPDGETTLDLLRADPVEGTDRIKQFTPGGTLFVIDPTRLDVLELKVDGSMLAGAR
jgi:hypothetical protein